MHRALELPNPESLQKALSKISVALQELGGAFWSVTVVLTKWVAMRGLGVLMDRHCLNKNSEDEDNTKSIRIVIQKTKEKS